MEKEGIDFVNVSKVDIHMKKKLGVFGGAGIMLILMLLVIGVLIYGYVVDADMPLWALTLVIVPIVAEMCIRDSFYTGFRILLWN